MAASVGQLVASLGLELASFRGDMGKAQQILNSNLQRMDRRLEGFGQGLKKAFTAIGVGLALRELQQFGKAVIDAGDQAAKTAEKFGVSVEKFSEYRFGAQLAGVESEKFESALSRLAKTAQDAADKPLGDQARAFRQIGVEVTDSSGKVRSLESIMDDVGDSFAGAADDSAKTALAVKLFGDEAGPRLIPFLNTLRETGREARRTGNIITSDFGRAAREFKDTFTRIQTAMVTFAANSSAFRGVMNLIAFIFKSAASLALTFAKDVEVAGRALGALGAAAVATVQRDWGRVRSIYDELKADIVEIDQRTTAQIEGIWAEHVKKVAELGGDARPSFGDNREASVELLRVLSDFRKATEQVQLGFLVDEEERAEKSLAIDVESMRAKVELFKGTVAERRQVEEAFQEWLAARERQAGLESRTPFELLLDNWSDVTTQMKAKTAEWAEDAASALTEFALTGKLNFREFARSIIADLIKIRIQQQLVGIFNAAGRGAGALGQFASGLFGVIAGARAEGGPVVAGRSYLVGERGAEVITPGASGFVTPRAMMGGAQLTQNITIDARGADRGAEARIRQAMLVAKEQAKAELIQEVQAGGNTARVFGR